MMKKLFTLLMIMMLCFACFGCSSDKSPESDNSTVSVDITEDMGGDDVAAAALKAYFEGGNFKALTEGYEEITASEGRTLVITQADEYVIPDIEGYKLNILLINAEADVYVEDEDTIYDRIILLVNLDNGKVYDNYTMGANSFGGNMENEDDVLTYCLALYNSYLMGANEGVMTSAESGETRTALTADDIAAINESIK